MIDKAEANTYENISVMSLVSILQDICGKDFVFFDIDYLDEYGRDCTLGLQFPFDVLIKPASSLEISSILKVCNQYKIPVTPRGGGSGVTGGALPVRGGIVLSLERLNKIIEIDTANCHVIAESGVITQDLCHAVEQAGLFFPISPSSSSYCFIGGNVAENAGSINSCKYGTTSAYVLNLEVVLPNGEVIWTGANVSKNVTGFNLTQLFVGSEGVLGVITKVVYRLIKKPIFSVVLLTTFQSLENACEVVLKLKSSTVLPSAVEIIAKNAIELGQPFVGEKFPWLGDNVAAQLLIELQEYSEGGLNASMDTVFTLLEPYTSDEIYVASSDAEREKFWKLRRAIGSALTSNNKTYRDIDIAVPLSFLFKYITGVETITRKHHIRLATFGHALDGNLHTMLMLSAEERDHIPSNFVTAVEEVYEFAIANGGVISGEHGIGFLQKAFMHLQFPDPHLALLKNIKVLFDPTGILNPGKIF